MKHLNLALYLSGLILLCSCEESRFVEIETDYGERVDFTRHSSANGSIYHLNLLVPEGYARDTLHYPLWIQLDGNTQFELAAQSATELVMTGQMPEILVVGVGYASEKQRQKLRVGDYTPTDDPILKNGGKAKAFLQFLEVELLPYLRSQYRIDTTSIILSGHSLGGLFASYAWMQRPELFKGGCVATSPSLWWNSGELLVEVKHSSSSPLVISYGTEEGALILPFVNEFVELNQARFPLLHAHKFRQQSNQETIPSGIKYGMQTLL